MKTNLQDNICGIYCIENIKNHKKYIGQSKNIRRRFWVHTHTLNKNEHCNKHLQKAWNLYGSESFKFYVIEECLKEELDDKEKYYIEKYNTLKNGYNLNAGGQGIPEYKHTQEEIEKMIQIQHPKPVYQCDLNLNILKEWPSAHTAAKRLGFVPNHVKNCCEKRMKSKSVHGYIFVYVEDYNNLDRDYYLNNKRDYPQPVLQIDKNGKIVHKWNSAYEIQKNIGIDCGEISAVCNGKRKTSQGYFWIKECDYDEDKIDLYKLKFLRNNTNIKKMYKYDINWNFVCEYPSHSECINNECFSRSTLDDHLKSKKPYLGFYYVHDKI